jgi:hypothetical protein
MTGAVKRLSDSAPSAIAKILVKFECLAFDANLRRTCINIGQKLRFIANDSFKPVCYVLGKAAESCRG